ncbi:acyltransferase [Paraglaciecola aquimarina]|uniref:Acyltransferase n=1 Tax=Paraglaciecola aquimarina TaxID=1235557 RepID=A0ABU3T280_9ALTE|nr:acyltransferase [Paraglaciecola aquimarina]MDU0356371.1 acyltransferase [Paraglaciecola aquimarina]
MIHPLSDVKSESVGENTNIWQFSVVAAGAIIGNDCNVCSHCFIENGAIIGNNVTIKNGVFVWDGVHIEDNVFIGPNVTFTNDRNPKSKNKNFLLEKTRVMKGASIGGNATILPGVSIGENAVVGAGSVVTKDVLANTVVKGNPAR